MVDEDMQPSSGASALQLEAGEDDIEAGARKFVGVTLQLALLLNVLIVGIGLLTTPDQTFEALPSLAISSLGALAGIPLYRRGDWRLGGRVCTVGLYLSVSKYCFDTLGPHPLVALSFFNVIMVAGFALGAKDAAVGTVLAIVTMAAALVLRSTGLAPIPLASDDGLALQLGLIFSVAFGSSLLTMGLLHQQRILRRVQDGRRLTQRALAALAEEEEARQRGASWAEALARLGQDLVDLEEDERRPARLAVEALQGALPDWIVLVSTTVGADERQVVLGRQERPPPISEGVERLLIAGRPAALASEGLQALAAWLDAPALSWGFLASGPDTDGIGARVVVACSGKPQLEPHPAALLETAAGMVAAAQKRLQREDNVRRIARMDALGQAAGGIAHDFRNVLTTIVGQTEMLHVELTEDRSARGRLQTIRTASERGRMLSSKLLSFSSRARGPQVAVPLGTVATELLPLLSAAAGGDCTVALSVEPDLGAVRLEEGDLEQILLNLVLNARDAEPQDGRIEVTLRRGRPRRGEAGESWRELVVRDQGRGMSPSVRMRALEPFFSTKDPGVGTGLGLAVVYGIVRRASGTLDLHSVPGSGTQILVRLPALELYEAPSVADPPAPGQPTAARVLLVEDEPTVRATLAELLGAEGFHVVTAEDGVKALEVVAGGLPVDVIVSDLTMPGLDGYGLSEALAAQGFTIPMVLVSGYAAAGPLPTDPSGLVVQQLAKPLHPRELSEAVRRALASAEGRESGVAEGRERT